MNNTTNLKIELRDMDGALIAAAPVSTDEHGYLYATHPAFDAEMQIALYGYQEGGTADDVIEDDDGVPYMRWRVIDDAPSGALAYVVETLVAGQWESLWADDDAPVLFNDRRDAERDLAEHLEAMEGAGMDYDESDYQIVSTIK